MTAFILVREHDKGTVYRLNIASIKSYRGSTSEDYMEYGAVVFLEGGGRLNVKETVREIDSKICSFGGNGVETVKGVNA